ncbi:hypothetical protein, partial [Elstera sp.]|uniref:hypothetical protein n=1 Tax=Elstera sp. TaxID=1916664 RepID=UPI0037C07720
MVSPLPPSAPDAAVDTSVGGDGMDFDALDFTFLDGEDAVLSTEGTASDAPKSPASDETAPTHAPRSEDGFDLAAWDSADPVTTAALPPETAAPEALD